MGSIQFAGPIEFGGRYWIAGNSPLSVIRGERPFLGRWGPLGGRSHRVGRGRELAEVLRGGGVEFVGLQLTTSPEEVLITGQRSSAMDPSVLAQFPPELVPGLERGDFSWWYDRSNISIVAPPGIELFRVPAIEAVQPWSRTAVLLRSDNLIIWEETPITFSSWSVATTLDGGFVSNADDGDVMYSSDGRSWERTDRFPALFYQSWGDRLVGLDFSVIHPHLIVFDGEKTATIDLPSELTDYEYGIAIIPGAAGLATILGTYENISAEPISGFDGYIVAMDKGILRIEEPPGETTFANFGGDGLIAGRYLPETDSIQFENSDGSKVFEFPVAVLLDLRQRIARGLFEVFLSNDGLEWARPQTGLRAGHADILGGAGETFLVALHNYERDYQELPITVYLRGRSAELAENWRGAVEPRPGLLQLARQP